MLAFAIAGGAGYRRFQAAGFSDGSLARTFFGCATGVGGQQTAFRDSAIWTFPDGFR